MLESNLKKDIVSLLKSSFSDAQKKGALPPHGIHSIDIEITIERTKNPEHGDICSTLPLRLAKPLKMSPMAIAKALIEEIHPPGNTIKEIVPAAPGFINFHISDEWYTDQVNEIIKSGHNFGNLSNGSGKSTLMKALIGAQIPDRGAALVAERNVRDWDRKALARAIGVVSQTERVSFPINVREMVSMGRYPHLGLLEGEDDKDRHIVREAMEVCDVKNLANRDLSTLSGGESQRVRIARALAQEPTALVLDEPTSSLDIKHTMEILELLKQSVASGLTVILITHGLDLAARFSDRMLLLSEGQVAVEGTPAEVVNEDALAKVYDWPVRVQWESTTGSPSVTPLHKN